MRILKKYSFIILVIVLGLIFRLILSPFGDNHDLLSNAGWGEWIYRNGPKGFYENNIWIYAWPTQLPLINLIYGFNYYLFHEKLLWFVSYVEAVIKTHQFFPQHFVFWFDFVYWFGTDLFKDTPYKNGFLISMKIIPMLSDLLIGLVIYIFGIKIVGIKKSLLSSSLFLFLPASWYVSSLWGQYDQLSGLLLVASFLLLYKRSFVFSTLLLFMSIQVKPTIILFMPFYIYYFLSLKPSIKSFFLSILVSGLAFILVTIPFTDKNPFIYTYQIIYPKVFNHDRFGLATHSFNFWQMLAPFGGWSTTFRLFGINALIWGLIFLAIVNFYAFKNFIKEKNLKNLIISLYLISAGSYLFATGMLDRYFYPAIVFLGLAVFYFPKLLKWFIITALIFSFNLFYSWGFPILSDLLIWKNEYIIRFFSLLNIIVFFICFNHLGLLKKFSKSRFK